MVEKRRNTFVRIFDSAEKMGRMAALEAAAILSAAIEQKGGAALIAATGVSQFAFLESLVQQEVDWPKVTMFHLDEYVGLPETHPASFCRYLKERFVSKVPLGAVHLIDGNGRDPAHTCRSLGREIRKHVIDAAFIGIGENGHIAFNDPPADFETTEPYIIVNLDEACRRQQAGEGWFERLEDVPTQAISMTVHEVLRAKTLICTCPDERKAEAVRNSLEGRICPEVPASIVRTHPDCRIFLDAASASKLRSVSA